MSTTTSTRLSNPWFTLVTIAIGAMMVSLDTTIVTVAQPVLQADLGASLTQIQWMTNGYLLALATLLITAGKLGDRFGHRTTYLVGTAGFVATSVAIGLSHDIGWVLVFRVLQGVFGAVMQPATLGLLRAVFPVDRMNMPIAVRSSVIAASTAAGPIIGGLLAQHVSWQSVFFLNAPLGLLAIVLTLLVVRDRADQHVARRFDVLGVFLLCGALFTLIWGLTAASDHGWTNAGTVATLGAAVVLGTWFVLWEGRAADPLMPPGLWRSAPLSAGVVLMITMAFTMFGASFVFTFYLQNVLGLSPSRSGVVVLPLTVTMIVGAPLVALWMNRVGTRIPVVCGMLATSAATFGMAQLDARSSVLQIGLCFLVLGFGFSPVMIGATKSIIGNAPPEYAGVAGGLQQTAMQVGASLGTSALGAIVGSRVDAVLPGRLAEAGAPTLPDASDAVSVGRIPDVAGLPSDVAAKVAEAAHSSFVSGMSLTLTVACVVGLVGAAAGLLTRSGR
ncbi:MFS transporter [Lentzea sp. NBRC 105346]|uniref:DHA2 family efflux MFS transporter permease subunit n=1 Tax=Lentzea sp. NBRC 105346 TaxID=3032205 RepID=UPI0024A27DEC|nr:DHA2 family efflux MFS transporter permease subunit [Lentzea sp. NBRC 105346]GLZ29245.1 MFS transporter [Lentzea sp. NBRC 105346]